MLFEALFMQKPQISIKADCKGIDVKIQGDPAALAFILGIEMFRNPELKKLFEVALDSVNNPELREAYKDAADGMIRCDNN
jgi:hypothetical protein